MAAKALQGKRQLFTAKVITDNHRKSFAKAVKTISANVLFLSPTSHLNHT